MEWNVNNSSDQINFWKSGWEKRFSCLCLELRGRDDEQEEQVPSIVGWTRWYLNRALQPLPNQLN